MFFDWFRKGIRKAIADGIREGMADVMATLQSTEIAPDELQDLDQHDEPPALTNGRKTPARTK
jgi:hypothetical protein